MTLALTLFLAGLLTILLPCILPLIPIVLGVSVTGRNKWRPLVTIAGMLVSFVGFTFLLQTVLRSFVEFADILRITTYYILLLFGFGFLTHRKEVQIVGAIAGSLFFWDKGIVTVFAFAIFGVVAMEVGGVIAAKIQQLGSNIQQDARSALGNESPWTAFVIGLTLGLVWVPCAGPALSFALTLVRDEPGLRAMLYLLCYGLGTAVPLLLIGYGGQAAVHRVRAITPYTGIIKQVSGAILIVTAVMLHFHTFEKLQIWLLDNTLFGDIGTRIEDSLFGEDMEESMLKPMPSDTFSSSLPKLPKIVRAPELNSLGPWHNSEPLTLADLKGKVVLIDFWTYSCINCIRTLPYIQGYWEKFGSTLLTTGKDTPFVIIGVHTPEFIFEQDPKNVADAIKRHGLTYPVVQDNDFGTWNAFANHYWPAKYLIDADGYIRYTHFGEGAYDETDLAIRSLLAEIGVDTADMPVTKDAVGGGGDRSPETYLGARSWPALANAQGEPSDEIVTYTAPASLPLHGYALVGNWKLIDGEQQALQSDSGEIRMHWYGSEINLVLGPGSSAGPLTGEVLIDGKAVKTITIDRHDLYNLYTGPAGDHELILKLNGKGVEGYAFTFGG
jgi:cytochrome c biogenesis protein CcdA/thiol-disulfide isomerase/thioredoxin